ncbi:DUF2809 domain-containing protein [Polaribacter sp.]|uniref:ribosomal maturation YjgA family protein n=1 Tax=Polaribacter sp. TaxID=1920175 RepID=UPI003F6C8E09
MRIQFNLKYFIIFLILLLSEISIAAYATGFIRHTFGDYLCVILIYSFIKSIFKINDIKVAIFVLLLAYTIEFLQLLNLQKWYPLAYKKLLQLILGTSFSIADLVAYTLGIITTLLIENKLITNEKSI